MTMTMNTQQARVAAAAKAEGYVAVQGVDGLWRVQDKSGQVVTMWRHVALTARATRMEACLSLVDAVIRATADRRAMAYHDGRAAGI